MSTIGPTSPCTATVTPDEHGGLIVALHVPTYSGGQSFTLAAERDADGDWRVFIPWPDDSPEIGMLGDLEVANGIVYLGAPDESVPTTPPTADHNHRSRT